MSPFDPTNSSTPKSNSHAQSVIAAFCIAVLYSYFARFYSASSRELKRIGKHKNCGLVLSLIQVFADNMLRSLLYAHFAESLSGLATIRSYGEVNRFLHDNEYYIDLEDRAAFVTVTNQRCV